MKPKHRIPLALLGAPLLLLNPAAHAQEQNQQQEAAEVAESEETEESANAIRAKETAERAREIAERSKEVAEEAVEEASEADKTKETPLEKGNARRAKEVADRSKEAAERAEARAEQAAERAEEASERAAREEQSSEKVKKDRAERAKEASERGKDRAEREEQSSEKVKKDRAERAKEASGKERVQEAAGRPENSAPRADEKKPPVDMPVVPSTPLTPREDIKPEENDVSPDKEETAEITPEEPTSEPERQAETEVTEVTQEVLRDLEQRKTRIEGREQAQALIDDILGAESRISRAEIAREERYRTRFERPRPGQERIIEVTPEERRVATTYYQERLLGREVEGPPPEFFRRHDRRGDAGDQRVVERVEIVRPRYFNEGRRYVHYDSRAAIPAVLMAAQAMNHVRFQPTREVAPMFYERQEVSAPYAIPLPPENYRSRDSVVVSYPVDENSMISSEDILFMQGSTQFADPYSYEVIGVMADAMKAMPEEERFVIEGHASAEGSYESNMILSQQRAEHIVREIVRRGGVSPYRLLPVGYGESEARHPADAAERLRSQDRRVVVFRMKEEPVAQR
jgi:outer membrane protein OmpA-like peptidoglycan-associated protein